jgi:hypothetical protein
VTEDHEDVTSSEMRDITNFISQLRKACFIHGLINKQIQIIVHIRNPSDIIEAANMGTEEENALLSAKEKTRGTYCMLLLNAASNEVGAMRLRGITQLRG